MAEQNNKAMETAEGDALLELSAVSRTGVLLTAEGASTEETKEAEALPMAKQDDTAKETAEGPPTEENKETEQPASGATAPMAGQPVHAAPMAGQPVLAAPMAGQPVHASLAWDLAAAAKTKTVENPAFAGLPPKPRCRHCNTLLADGRCVEPECGKDQDVAEK